MPLQLDPILMFIAITGGTTTGRLADPVVWAILFLAVCAGAASNRIIYPFILAIGFTTASALYAETSLYMSAALLVSSFVLVGAGWFAGRLIRRVTRQTDPAAAPSSDL